RPSATLSEEAYRRVLPRRRAQRAALPVRLKFLLQLLDEPVSRPLVADGRDLANDGKAESLVVRVSGVTPAEAVPALAGDGLLQLPEHCSRLQERPPARDQVPRCPGLPCDAALHRVAAVVERAAAFLLRSKQLQQRQGGHAAVAPAAASAGRQKGTVG